MIALYYGGNSITQSFLGLTFSFVLSDICVIRLNYNKAWDLEITFVPLFSVLQKINVVFRFQWDPRDFVERFN